MDSRKYLFVGWIFFLFMIPSVLAWISPDFAFRYEIHSNSTNATDIISANDTFGIYDDIIWTQNGTGTEEIYVYCEDADCSGNKAIGNDTHEKCFLNETDGSGNCPNDISNDNLLAWWTLNNATGMDVSNMEHNLTITGAPTPDDAVFGQGWENIGGGANYGTINIADAVFVHGQPELSITGWIWRDNVNANHVITQKSLTYIVRGATLGRMNVFIYTAGGDVELKSPNGEMLARRWYHIAITYDGNDFNLYMNGSLIKTSPAVGGNTDAFALPLGVGHDGAGADAFNGYLDDIRIYNLGLSQKEVQDLYWAGLDNHTHLGSVEFPPPPAVDLNLTLNGTRGNVTWLTGSVGNFTVTSNTSALANITVNITGFTGNSSMTPYSHYEGISCTENSSLNVTAYIGNGSWTGFNETHFINCYVFPPEPTYPYGVNIVIIEEEKPKGIFERWFPRIYDRILHFGMIIDDLNMGGNDILGVRNVNASGNITGNSLYAEMWNYSSGGWTFDFPVVGTYYNLTNISNAENLWGFTHTNEVQDNGGSYLTAQESGRYKVMFSISYSGLAGGQYGFGVVENFDVTSHRECYSRGWGDATVRNIGVSCLVHIYEGETLNIQVEDENAPTKTLTIHTVNLNVVRIGN